MELCRPWTSSLHYTHLAWSYQVICQSNAEFHGSTVTLMLHEAGRAHLHDADALRHSVVCTHLPSLSSSDSNTAHTHRPSLCQPTTHTHITDHMQSQQDLSMNFSANIR